MREHKILITGTMGSGKTTAIAAISEIPPISTDVLNTDKSIAKLQTTVGLDYGEVTLANGEKLRLYGTPGQLRFDFMWKILAKGALGLIILIDNSRPDPLADFSVYIDGFKELMEDTACVVAIGRSEMHASPGLDDFSDVLASKGLVCPIVAADVRKPSEVLVLLDLLLVQIEAKAD
jgi:uncharacterized protein